MEARCTVQIGLIYQNALKNFSKAMESYDKVMKLAEALKPFKDVN